MAQSLVWLAQSYFMKGDINAAIHAFNESLNGHSYECTG